MDEWTIAQMREVEKRYSSQRAASIASDLGRTTNAVRNRAALLGVRKWLNIPWMPAELELLDTHYAEGMEALVAVLPHRGREAIRVMANLRGLTLRGWSPEELAILREHYPTKGGKCSNLLPRRSQQAIKLAARRLGLSYQRQVGDGTSTLPWSTEELERLTAHQHLKLGELAALFPHRSKVAIGMARTRLRRGSR